MSHKAGFVNIIGNPNVGKSTLMNAFVGERLSIITSKAQTTRHRYTRYCKRRGLSDDFERYPRYYKAGIRATSLYDGLCKKRL
ncbi:GTPase Era [Dokdonia donghaensis DSW-1]|nr:GTPase Era [Dokdonia donghaensis DSW-1]